jgi:Lrp/AsnC family transcriptional regulator for asnA, asnC and gidA
LDEIDAEIIKILCKDARTPFSKIGQRLGIGTDTVFRRFRKLEQKGIVSGSTVVLSSKACGIKGFYCFFVKLQPGSSVLTVKDKLIKLPKLCSLVQTWGEFDFYLEMGFMDFGEVDPFINSLREIKEIAVIDSMLYASQDFSLPNLSTFESEIPDWFFRIKE